MFVVMEEGILFGGSRVRRQSPLPQDSRGVCLLKSGNSERQNINHSIRPRRCGRLRQFGVGASPRRRRRLQTATPPLALDSLAAPKLSPSLLALSLSPLFYLGLLRSSVSGFVSYEISHKRHDASRQKVPVCLDCAIKGANSYC